MKTVSNRCASTRCLAGDGGFRHPVTWRPALALVRNRTTLDSRFRGSDGVLENTTTSPRLRFSASPRESVIRRKNED